MSSAIAQLPLPAIRNTGRSDGDWPNTPARPLPGACQVASARQSARTRKELTSTDNFVGLMAEAFRGVQGLFGCQSVVAPERRVRTRSDITDFEAICRGWACVRVLRGCPCILVHWAPVPLVPTPCQLCVAGPRTRVQLFPSSGSCSSFPPSVQCCLVWQCR